MWRIKRLADPDGDPRPRGRAQPRPRASTCATSSPCPRSRRSATKCIECGFCEPVCPSPQRDHDARASGSCCGARWPASRAGLAGARRRCCEQYEYDGDRDLRRRRLVRGRLPGGDRHRRSWSRSCARRAPRPARRACRRSRVARRYAARRARRPRRAASPAPWRARRARGAARPARGCRRSPTLHPEPVPTAPSCPRRRRRCREQRGAAAVYLPVVPEPDLRQPRADSGGAPDAARGAGRRLARAGLPLWIPADVAGHCCGTPWSSKGYRRRPRRRWRPRTAAALRALDRRRPAAGGDRRQLVHARPAERRLASDGRRGASTR